MTCHMTDMSHWGQIQLKVFELQIQILLKLQNTNTNTNFFIVFEIQIQNTSNVFQIQLQILSPNAIVFHAVIDSLNIHVITILAAIITTH